MSIQKARYKKCGGIVFDLDWFFTLLNIWGIVLAFQIQGQNTNFSEASKNKESLEKG